MPIGNATSQVNMRLPREITTVHISRSQISDDTGCFQWKERPKSPSRMMLLIQRKYCSTIGRSSP